MDIFANFATNLNDEENGRYFENGDVEFLIARSGNRTYNDMISTQFTAHKHILDQKDTPEARFAANACADKINVMVMSRAILLGWRGLPKKNADGTPMLAADGTPVLGSLRDRDGSEMAFNVFSAAKILALKDFRAWVSTKSDDFRNYLEEVKKADEKNSEPTSTGNSPGVVA